MRILFLHNNDQDYLSESVFHGLRSLLANKCIDFPRYEIMYNDGGTLLKNSLRGNGFTLYGLLEDNEELKAARFRCLDKLDTFDFIIISNIWSQFNLLKQIKKYVSKDKLVILDGGDNSPIYPYAAFFKNIKMDFMSYFFSCNSYKYFKREIEENSSYNLVGHILSRINLKYKTNQNFLPISFSIPKEKIVYVSAKEKIKTFQTHIVDDEVASRIKDAQFSAIGSDKLFFYNETDYFKDLQISKFGITTKRAGWDCLRHYELAANGAVICFRDLDKKTELCAPHITQDDCICYNDYNQLIHKINALTDTQYEHYLKKNYEWIERNTTLKKAEYILDMI